MQTSLKYLFPWFTIGIADDFVKATVLADTGRFADHDVCAYELFGDSVELSRRIDSELTGQGFKRITEEGWSKGRKVEYQSADEMTQVFQVSEVDQARPVSFWIR